MFTYKTLFQQKLGFEFTCNQSGIGVVLVASIVFYTNGVRSTFKTQSFVQGHYVTWRGCIYIFGPVAIYKQ